MKLFVQPDENVLWQKDFEVKSIDKFVLQYEKKTLCLLTTLKCSL